MGKDKYKAVQKTNDSCVVSKCSMSKHGYFDDKAVPLFVSKEKRRSPLIHRGYYIRAKALQKTLDLFFQNHPLSSQILSLGAGFDSTYFRLKIADKLPLNSVFFEVDFPEVVRNKKNIIINNEVLSKFINYNEGRHDSSKSIVLNTNQYKLIGNDLKDLHKMDHLLEECGLKKNIPTLIITECVLTYLDGKSATEIINWSARNFLNAVYFTYEQIHPSDSFGHVMMNHFESIGSPLKSIHLYPDKHSQIERYLNNGWEDCLAIDMNSFLVSFIDDEEQDRIEMLEPFDEIEEFHLKCSHYLALWAVQGDCKPFANNIKLSINHINDAVNHFNSPCPVQSISSYPIDILRHGHSSIIHHKYVLSFGGFGIKNGCHRRLNDIHCIDLMTQCEIKLHVCDDAYSEIGARIHHTATNLQDTQNGFVIFGGRNSPMKATNSIYFFPFSSFKNIFAEFEQLKNSSCSNFSSKLLNVTCTEIQQKGEIPCPRWRHSASVIDLKGLNYLIIFGGRSEKQKYLSDCYALNTKTWVWKEISSAVHKPSPRHSHSSVTWNHNIIISCGLGKRNKPLNSIYLLNCNDMAWKELNNININKRYSHSSHVWNDKLFLIGGVNCNALSQPGIGIVDLSNMIAIEYQLTNMLPLPVFMYNHSAVINEETQEIIILGGGGNCFSFGTHLNSTMNCIKLDSFF